MDVWRQVAQEIGGSFVEAAQNGPSILRRAGDWDIVLRQGSLPGRDGTKGAEVTFLTTLIVNSAGLEFMIYREGVEEKLTKLFGSQDLQTGDREFDRIFVCKGNSEQRLRELFSDMRLKSLMLAAPETVWTLSFFRPDKLDTILRDLLHRFLPADAADMEAAVRDKAHCYCKGILNDAGAIKRMFETFELLLARLAKLGYARPPAP